MRTLGAITAFGLAAALWLLFAPTQIGGQAGYVVVTGTSMEPDFQSGDLAIIRRSSEYQTGDVVTYEHPELGAVFHRIVGVDGARFTLQGDDNAWTDSYQPAQDEIAGKLWFHVPSAGQYLRYVRSPGALALLSIVIGLTIMLPGRKDRPKKTPDRSTGGLPSLMEPRGRDLMGLLAMFAIAALALAGLAFTRSLDRETVQEIPYEHSGSFSYSAAAPDGIYDASEVVAGEPVFRALIDSFDVQFDYAFHSNAPVSGTGTSHLQAELHSDNGWKRTIELQPARAFDGPATTLSGSIDLSELQRIIERVQSETGIAARQYTLTIQPDITMDANVGGQAVQEQFAPAISFLMDEQQLQLVTTSADDENVLEQGAGGLTTRTDVEPNTLPLPVIELQVGTARTLSLFALGLILLAGGAIVAQTLRVRGNNDADRMSALYGARLVAVRAHSIAGPDAGIEVSGFSDFLRLLEHHDGPIFRDGPTFFIDYDGQRFRHCTDPDAVTPAIVEVAEEVEPAPETRPVIVEIPKALPRQAPKRRQSAISQLLFNRAMKTQRKGWTQRA